MADLSDPVSHARVIVPDDILDLNFTTTALYVGVAGALTVTMMNGDGQKQQKPYLPVTFTNLPVGWHPLRVTKVWATGTAADDIIGVW